MNRSPEQGVMSYMAFRLSHAMFQRAPDELGAAERARLSSSVKRQFAIEQRVLASPEAEQVAVPASTVEDALEVLRGRYEDGPAFAAAIDAQGFDEAALRAALHRGLRVEAVLDRVAARSARVSELDVQLHYHLRAEQFQRPERRAAAHILITINEDFPDNTRARAAQRIAQVLERLRKDPARFAEQAMKHSECPTAMNGGNLGEYAAGQLFPQLDAALFSMRVGELSEVVESELGFHLLRCDGIRPAGPAPFAEVEKKIRELIEAKRRRLCQREWIAGLMGAPAGA